MRVKRYWYSIIVPVKDDLLVFNLVRSLVNDHNFDKIELIIVLNGASGKFTSEIENSVGMHKNCKVVSVSVASTPKALNTGIRKSSSRKIVIIDSDCVISKSYIKNMYFDLRVNNVVNGQIIFTGNNWFSKLTARMAGYVHSKKLNYMFTPNLGLDKKVFEECGFFNEDLRYSFDSEFSVMIRSKGYKPYFSERCTVSHACHTSIKKQMVVWYYYGEGRYNKYINGSFGKPGFVSLVKCLVSSKVFYREEGVVYNFYALFYILVRDFGVLCGFQNIK